jgi:hypothetical protein
MSALLDQWTRAMRAGDYEAAWAVDERLATARSRATPDDPSLPYHLRWVWDLRELAGREVLVRCYHGLGDTIQFLRFLPLLSARAASVSLEIQPRLIPLLGDDRPVDRIIPFDFKHPTPPAERNIEIMELPFALRARPSAFAPPYIQAPPVPLPAGAIGLCCIAGDWDEGRSIPAELLAPLCEGREVIALDPRPSTLPARNPLGCPFDVLETACLIAGLSLVITVDTMIAHLAGAMNRPTWLLLKHRPDWRWAPATGRSDWYPSMRLYAQPRPGDWAGVAEAVSRDLDKQVPKRRTQDESGPRLSSCTGFLGRAPGQDHHSANQT